MCPWCWISKVRLDRAIDAWQAAAPEDEPRQVERVWHAFELDPNAARGAGTPRAEHLAAHKGLAPAQVDQMFAQVTQIAAQDGLDYDLEGSITAATRDAHRVGAHARLVGKDTQWHERLLRAHLAERADVGDHETLAALAGEVGLDEAEVREILASDAFAREVDEDIAAARSIGVSGVPFVVVDQSYGVSGAQPVEVFVDALTRAAADRAEGTGDGVDQDTQT